MSIKDKIYNLITKKNKEVRETYEDYKNSDIKFHEKNKLKSWSYLIKLLYASKKGRDLCTVSVPTSKIETMPVGCCSQAVTSIVSPVDNRSQAVTSIVSHQKQFCDDTLDFIKSAWTTYAPINDIIDRAYECVNNQWYKQYGNSEIYLILISCLIEANRVNEAENILYRYYNEFGSRDIFRYLLVAKLAVKLKLKANASNAAYVYDRLEINRKNEVFSNLIKNASSIAVVGNSGRELGKKLGKQIDSHDIVIRFNNYPGAPYAEDYGSKTDIWVRGGNKGINDRKKINIYKCVYWEPEYSHIKIQNNHIELLFRDLKSNPNKVCNTSSESKRSLIDFSGLLNPSSGCLILWEIYRILGSFDKVDVYGFAFIDKNINDSSHYYDDLCRFNVDHNLAREISFLYNLYFNNKKPNITGALTVPDVTLNAEYQLPEILLNAIAKKPRYKIFACAYRVYDESTGKTGGPGGVLAMQKKLFGEKYKGIDLSYHFEHRGFKYPDNLHDAIDKLAIKVKNNFMACYYIQTNREIQNDLNDGVIPLFICHDIGSAYGAYLCGCRYVLIFHQQGGIVNEMRAVNAQFDDRDVLIINELEKVVFENAAKVYFPSLGAMNVFKRTSLIGQTSTKINYSDHALYNTIPHLPRGINYSKLLKKFNLPDIDRENTDVFLSVGDYNYDKGMERVPMLLNKYVSRTGRKVLWIAIGGAANSDLYSSIIKNKKNYLFESVIIGERTDHDSLFALVDYSDYYIMLHRNSIFDLAILEAMQFGKAVILSNVGGNPEFNREDNVVLVHDDDYDGAVSEILLRDKHEWGIQNKKVFDEYFSNECFIREYAQMIDEQLSILGYDGIRFHSAVNAVTFAKFKDKHRGETAVICGAGSSLDGYVQDKKSVHIALNKVLFCNNVRFDYLFMQDYPQNQPYTMEDYNAYPCTKFYGCILNTQHAFLGIKDEDIKNVQKGECYRFELSPRIFNFKYDYFETELDKYCISDAQSVLFSALQFAVFAGFSDIKLIGVDFSSVNYSNTQNASKYAKNVTRNLLQFKQQIEEKGNTKISFIKTTNTWLKRQFSKKYQKIVVTGIYTNSYKHAVELQKQSCLDDYEFDFRYITDEQWQKAKTSSDFAFYGGNTIKTQLVIDKIKQYWGRNIIVADADVIFLKPTEEQIWRELGDKDMLFLKERRDHEHNPFEKTPLNINIGFVVINCNERSLLFWQEVQEQTKTQHGWDQEIANYVVKENNIGLNWALLSDYFLNGGDLRKKNVKTQLITTACGTIAQKYKLSKPDFLAKILSIVDGKDTKWFDNSPIA